MCKLSVNDVIKYGNNIALLLYISEKFDLNQWMYFSKKITAVFSDAALILSPRYDGRDVGLFIKPSKIAKELNIRLAASARPIMHQSSRRRVIDVLSAIRNNCTIEALGYKAERNAERRL